jgi:predicted transcriptional regulator
MTIKDLKASAIMVRPVLFARRGKIARDIALQLLTGGFSEMPVLDEEGRVIGMLTEHDLIKAAETGGDLAQTTAEEIMSTEVVTAERDTQLGELMKRMTDQNIHRLLITDQGRLVGVVAQCDVLKILVDPDLGVYWSEWSQV